jgi:hypothetical protein
MVQHDVSDTSTGHRMTDVDAARAKFVRARTAYFAARKNGDEARQLGPTASNRWVRRSATR